LKEKSGEDKGDFLYPTALLQFGIIAFYDLTKRFYAKDCHLSVWIGHDLIFIFVMLHVVHRVKHNF
jgi:hypothetical protein